MANLNELDELFEGLDGKMDFLNERSSSKNSDGIYRIDLTKCKDKKIGYKSTIRFLPNLTKEGVVGQSAIEKITHYVDIKNPKELSGFFDSPKNFDPKASCPLTTLYYQLDESKNIVLKERAKSLKYSRKYYSYVLIIEDEQQPELVGKIMIFQYGKTIREKILSERNGEIDVPCNVFDLANGKDFVLRVKEIQTGDETYPDYKSSGFKRDSTSLPIFFKEKSVFKNIPLTSEGKISPDVKQKVKEFLIDREHDLEDFSPKPLTEEQQAKITDITNFLTGKASSGFKKEQQATSDDFEFEDSFSTTSSTNKATNDDEDDFFDEF
jgi:hypothetical protein